MGKVFSSFKEAARYFGSDIETEECDGCGAISASLADHYDGAIVGPYCDDDGNALLERVCEDCSELDPEDLGV